MKVAAVVAGLSVLAPFTVGVSAAAGERTEMVLRFSDPELIESSGLVVVPDGFATVNDSGDSARVFTVAPDGTTSAITTWDAGATDIEALAPTGGADADPNVVWVGDIGDNRAQRKDVEVWRVPLSGAEEEVPEYKLDYPGGARDAEALLVHPATGRMYVASKAVFGGEFYAAPEELSERGTNRLEALGDVAGLVTDGAFFLDGKHFVLRNYTRAFVYDFATMELVGDFALPRQEQGEGIAVGADNALYLSSEGRNAPLLKVRMPGKLRALVAPTPTPTPSPDLSPGPSPSTTTQPLTGEADSSEDSAGPGGFVIGGAALGALVMLGALAFGIRALRPR